jgi:hypothetical protein
MARPWPFLSACVVLLALAGCGETYHSVSGSVTLDGKPFENGSITLVPVAGGSPAFGATDAKGQFTLETGNRSGVRPGEYTVVLARLTAPKLDPKDTEGRNIPENFVAVSNVPAKYAKAETSDLKLTVPSADGKYVVSAKSN